MGWERRYIDPLPCPYLTTKNLLGPATSHQRLDLQLRASWPAPWLSHSCIPKSKADAPLLLASQEKFQSPPSLPSSRLLISCTWGVSTCEVFAWCLLVDVMVERQLAVSLSLVCPLSLSAHRQSGKPQRQCEVPSAGCGGKCL